ncbi:hypothetical protein D3C77_556720 [compost metagenome]
MDYPRCAICDDALQVLVEGDGYWSVVCADCDKYRIDHFVLLAVRSGRCLDKAAMKAWLESQRLGGCVKPRLTMENAVWLSS